MYKRVYKVIYDSDKPWTITYFFSLKCTLKYIVNILGGFFLGTFLRCWQLFIYILTNVW